MTTSARGADRPGHAPLRAGPTPPGAILFRAAILETARAEGADLTAILPVDVPSRPHDLTVPGQVRRIRDFWSTAMRTVRRSSFPIRVAQRSSIDDCSVLGLAAKTAPDLRSALQRLIEYQWIWTGKPEMSLSEDPERGLAFVEILPLEGFDLGGRCRRELITASVLKFARDMVGGDLRPLRVHFAHRAPAGTDEHEAFFGAEIRFESARTGLELDLTSLDRPLLHADPGLSTFLLEILESMAIDRRRRGGSAIEDSVRRAIRERLACGVPRIAEIATELGTSDRSLRRHLRAGGARYRDLLDEARRELAEERLELGDEPVAGIAERVGFSEPSAFYRAFRRWTGGGRIRDRRGPRGA